MTCRTAIALLLIAALVATGCTAVAGRDVADEVDPFATAIPADPTTPASAPSPSDVPAAAAPIAAADGSVPGDPDLRVLTFAPGEPVRFSTTAEDLSWAVSVSAEVPGDLVGIRQVTDPGGEIRYLADLGSERLISDELHPRVLADADAVGLYVPLPADGQIPPGQWQVQVVGNDAEPAVRVVIRRLDPAQAGGHQIDIWVWATAADVDVDAVQQRWRDDMDAVLAPHGIRVGRLDVVPAGPAGDAFAMVGVDGLADEGHRACDAAAAAVARPARSALVVLADNVGEGVLSAQAAPADGPASVHPALDEHAQGTAYRRPDGVIEGFTVATPGTPYLGPDSHACVLVNARGDAPARGLVALHEVLHQAGLTRHTTEADGLAFDLLDDTPECPRDPNDTDLDGTVSRAECLEADGDNLLFWAIGGTQLSAAQAQRVRAHPLLRPVGG